MQDNIYSANTFSLSETFECSVISTFTSESKLLFGLKSSNFPLGSGDRLGSDPSGRSVGASTNWDTEHQEDFDGAQGSCRMPLPTVALLPRPAHLSAGVDDLPEDGHEHEVDERHDAHGRDGERPHLELVRVQSLQRNTRERKGPSPASET